jgi:hypothetical protein
MDLSKLSDNDLRALKGNNFSALSDEGLVFLKQATTPQMSDEERAERQGFGSAFGSSLSQFATAGMRGAGELLDIESLTKSAKAREARERADPSFVPTTQEDVTKAFEEGILSGAGAAFRQYVSEPAGELAGGFVAPLAVGAAAIPLAPKLGLGALGTFLLAGATTALAEFPSAVGDTIQRMEQEGQPVDVGRATAFAIPQAVLYGFGLPGVGVLPKAAQRIFKSKSDDVAERVLAGKLTKEEGIKELSGTLSNIVKETAVAGAAGASVVTGVEALKRGAAGQELTDDEALDAYLEQALAAGAVAPLFGVPIGGFRGRGQKRQVEAAGAQREQQDALKRIEEETAAAQRSAVVKPVPRRPEDGFSFFQDNRAEQLATRGREQTIFSPEEMGGEVTGPPQARDVEVPTAEPAFSRFELTQKEGALRTGLDDLRTRINQAAEARDFGALEALTGQARTLQAELKATSEQLQQAGGAPKSASAIQKQLNSRVKELQKAAAEGDTDKVAALVPKVRELEQELNQVQQAAQPDDLFARADREAAEGRVRVGEELASQTEDFRLMSERAKDVSDDAAQRLQDEVDAMPELLQKTSDENLVARMDEILQRATQNNATKYARTTDDRSQSDILKNQEKIDRLKRTMQEVVESGDLRPIPRLRNRLAELISEGGVSRPEILRDRALTDQRQAVEVVRSNLEDLQTGSVLGQGAQNIEAAASTRETLANQTQQAVAAYTDAAVREVNAFRRSQKQQPLTNAEAIRLSMDVRGRLEAVIGQNNLKALELGKGGLSPVERQLAQLKQKYLKGAPLRQREEGFRLTQDQDALEALRRERAKKDPNPEKVRLLERQVKALSDEDARLAEARLREEEAPAAAARDELSGIPGEGRQQQLFSAKDLEPIATTRATPENFMRYLRSDAVQKLRTDIADVNKQLDRLKAPLSNRSPKIDANLVASLEKQREFVKEVQNASILASNLRNNAAQLWDMRLRVQKSLDEATGVLNKAVKEKQPQDKINNARREVEQFTQALKKVDDNATARWREIAGLHKKANELLGADLKFEQAVLKGMEQRYAKMQKASPAARKLEADMRESRARIGAAEAAIKEQRDAQNKSDRAAEQARLEAGAERPKTIRTIEETVFQAPGAQDRVLQKRTKKVEPKSKEELREAQKRAQQDAADQIASRKARVEGKLALTKALKKESRLKKELDAVRKKIKAEQAYADLLKTDKAKGNAQTRINKLLDREGVVKTQLAELKDVGAGVERALVFQGDKPGREERKRPLKVGSIKVETAAQRDADIRGYFKEKGVSWDDYEAPDGTVLRVSNDGDGAKIDPAAASALGAKLEKNIPSNIKFESVGEFSELSARAKAVLERDYGIVEGSNRARSLRGLVTPDGEVFVVRNNHKDALDLETTFAHELIGHVASDRLLGPQGLRKLSDRIQSMPEGAYGLARALGIEDNFKGAMADLTLDVTKLVDAGASNEKITSALKDVEINATRELLAYTAEKRVTEELRQKLNRWYKEIVGVFRDWMRRSGMAELAKVSDADIYNIIRRALRAYNKSELPAHRDINGSVVFRSQSAPNPGFDPRIVSAISKIVPKEKKFYDGVKATTLGMQFMHRFQDRFAGVDFIARTGFKDSLEGVQMMYFNRIADQRSNMVANVVTNGAVRLQKNDKDGTFQYKNAEGASLKSVLQEVGKASKQFGNERFTLDAFGTYLAVERASSDKGGLAAGMRKLDLSGKISMDEAQRLLEVGRGNTNFQNARKMYREYNNGMIDLLVDTGRITKQQAADFKRGDYVPYYRERDGEIWDMEHNVKVGDIKSQPYLRELVGGDSAIVSFETGALQNTYLLTEMSLNNIATKNTAYTLRTLGIAELRDGDGPASPNVIRFYDNGEKKHAVLNTSGNYLKLETELAEMRAKGLTASPKYKAKAELAVKARQSEQLFGDIPADLIVKGMSGMSLELPLAIKFMQGPANLLRKAVTRNPAYAARIALKDSLYGWIATGADVKPVIGVLGNLKKSWTGEQPAIKKLQEQGIIGGHVFNGTVDDMRTVALQLSRGQKGWEKAMAKADRLAILADEAARVTLYDGFIKKGMTELEATLATLEAQNFTKHGFSPSVRYMSTMIPFFNAQIQGLNVFARALAGRSLFEDKLGVQTAALQRGAMLAGGTVLYATMMQDTEAYKNATQEERLNYWFVPVPFFDEPIRVPIPFEAGLVFKALPEAMVNLASADNESRDVFPALRKLALAAIPGSSNLFLPQGAKPLIELATNTSFYGMRPIEGLRAQQEEPGFRAGSRTTEVSKAIGELLNISPLKIDHFISGYTSSTGIALLSAFNPLLRDVDAPTLKASEFSIVGSFFQPTDGMGIINKVYEDMKTIEQIKTTYKRLSERDPAKADSYLQKNLKAIEQGSLAGSFRQEMGELNTAERAIRADRAMSSQEKSRNLDQIKQLKIELATIYRKLIRE